MKRLIPVLLAKGYSVTDLTEKNWMANTKKNKELAATVSGSVSTVGTFVILDLFGNSSTRYRTPDDSTSPATHLGRGGGGWHMLGDVTWASDKELGEQVDGLGVVFTAIKDLKKVVLPPIPRYMFGSCCGDTVHAANTGTQEHAEKTLSEHNRIRNSIKHKLVSKGTQHYRVLDVISAFTQSHLTTAEKTKALQTYTHRDNVHLTPEGYSKLADNILATVTDMHIAQSAQH